MKDMTKALEIVHTLSIYFDFRLNHEQLLSASQKVQEIIDRKCKHMVASEKVGNGPWKYCNDKGSFKCGACGVQLKVKEWEEVK